MERVLVWKIAMRERGDKGTRYIEDWIIDSGALYTMWRLHCGKDVNKISKYKMDTDRCQFNITDKVNVVCERKKIHITTSGIFL